MTDWARARLSSVRTHSSAPESWDFLPHVSFRNDTGPSTYNLVVGVTGDFDSENTVEVIARRRGIAKVT